MINFDAKDTAFSRNHSFKFGGRTLSRKGPLLMGILNITPDSFFEGSRMMSEKALLSRVGQMLDEGVALIDIGAVSTRPGADEPGKEEEMKRLIPAVRSVVRHFPQCFVSVDTWRAEVAKAALNEGAFMINDISGGTFDPEMPELIGRNNIPYVMMHIKGRPSTMQLEPLQASEVIGKVRAFFLHQLEQFEQCGARQIITDPGFGFGKTLEANYRMLNQLENLRIKEYPLLVGISRKSMIYKVLNTTPEEALNGTSVLHTISLLKGADILRVHDVKEADQVLKLLFKMKQGDYSDE